MPMAAKVAQPVNCLINGVVDSFMMMLLLSLSFHSRIGMAHHSSFGKVLSCGSLPLIGAKFRYLERKLEEDRSMLQNRRQPKAFKLGFGCPARYGEAELQNPVSNGEPDAHRCR